MFGEKIQRWSCRDCAFKFSDPLDVERAKKALQAIESIESMKLKSPDDIGSNCQICVENNKETKNLVADQTTTLVIPQKREYDKQDQKGAVVEFLFYMQKENRAKDTYEPYCYSLEFLINNGADLFDPESVKTTLTDTLNLKTNARKYNLVKAYKAFMAAYGLKGTLPSFKPTRKLPYLPPEAHMDQLIASCSYEMAALLQTLKETAARPVEALRILWDEIDFLQRKIPINHPAKGCNPRVLDMSDKLYQMLMNLPKDRKKVFLYKNSASAGKTLRVMRLHAIQKLGIKELRKITLYTFRYWRATVEFQEYKTEVAVMVLLGHKTTVYLWLYVQLAHIYFRGAPKKYVSLWVTNREEESKAVQDGFDYVRTDKDGASLYRRADTTATTIIGHD
jgi:integrase